MDNQEKRIKKDYLIELQPSDYFNLLTAFSPLIVSYTTKKVLESYTLHREYKPKNIKQVKLPPELTKEYNEIDINNKASQKFSESLKHFVEVMTKNFPDHDLTNLYNNINTLAISDKKNIIQKIIQKREVVGVYETKKNKIIVYENSKPTTIFHELLHMASSTHKDDIIYSGFRQASIKLNGTSIGRGINEGYTELLCSRYFHKDEELSYSYIYETFVAEKLEQIVGQEKMMSLYLNANLLGLINELKHYTTEEDIMKFISSTDFIIKHLGDKKLKLFEKNMITNSLQNINKFIIETYIKKLSLEYQQHKITYEQMIQDEVEFISSIPSALKIGKRLYQTMSSAELAKYVTLMLDKAELIEPSEEIKPHKNK